MPDRLAELRRQRSLLEQHLAWLDGEIATAERIVGATAPIALPTVRIASLPAAPAIPSPPSFPEVAPLAVATVDSAPAVEEILEQYRTAPTTVHQDVKKGCFLYFAVAFVVFGLGVTGLYFLISSR